MSAHVMSVRACVLRLRQPRGVEDDNLQRGHDEVAAARGGAQRFATSARQKGLGCQRGCTAPDERVGRLQSRCVAALTHRPPAAGAARRATDRKMMPPSM
jgi:hypothetical protein